jgi:hypothetical protein
VFGRAVADVASSMTIREVAALLDRQGIQLDKSVVEALGSLIASGLGDIAIGAECRALVEGDRARLRIVALSQLHLAEAKYYVRLEHEGASRELLTLLQAVTVSSDVVLGHSART